MFNQLFSSKINRALITLVLAAAVIALGAYAYTLIKQQSDWGGPMTINVAGKGEVMAVPDIAAFSFSVRAEGKDAAEAQGKSADAMNSILAYLKEQGIEDKDVKTAGYNLFPKYTYNQKPCALGMYCPPSDPVISGFEVSQTVMVKVRETDKAGVLLGNVGTKGATDISGLSFTIDDENALKAQARKAAIEDAQAQAKVLAKQLGVRLGEMMTYYEDVPFTPYHGAGLGGDMAMSAKAEMAPNPGIPTGENTITSNVTLTYKIH